jgi:hypothetical protein
MPKYYPNNRFSDCYSSVGNITFYHRDGDCYYKAKANPTFPGTSGQQEQLSLHRRAIKAWRTLNHDTQLQWNTLAKNVKSKRPPYNADTHISGYNLFVSAYHGLASTGNESIPTPASIPTFPHLHLEFKTSTVVNTADLTLEYTATIIPDTLKDLILIGKIQITKPGYHPNTGKYRNYTASLNIIGNTLHVSFTIPDYKSQEEDITCCTIHLKYFLIDMQTGFRNKETYLKTDIKSTI